MSWSVRNLSDLKWWDRAPRGSVAELVEDENAQVGVNLFVLGPGDPMSMYHWESDQEDFLVLSGEALLLVEDEERPLRQWDYFHCPPDTAHMTVGAGDGPCALLMVGTRSADATIRYLPHPVAAKHGVAVEQETDSPREAYANRPPIVPAPSPWPLK